jgi:hypothetical protein
MLTQIGLGQNALEYIHAQLKSGNTYARALLETSGFGKIYTFLPEKLKEKKQIEVSQSIYLSTGLKIKTDSKQIMNRFVHSFLQENDSRMGLVETYYGSDDVSKLINIPTAVFYSSEVYFFMKPRESLDVIGHGFGSARDYPFICGLIELKDEKNMLHENRKIRPEQWTTFALETQHIIVGAYDAEGYLVWSR